MIPDNIFQDYDLNSLISMDQQIPEAHHVLHSFTEILIDQSGLLKEIETVSTRLRDSQLLSSNNKIGHINSLLIGSLKIHEDRILPEVILSKRYVSRQIIILVDLCNILAFLLISTSFMGDKNPCFESVFQNIPSFAIQFLIKR